MSERELRVGMISWAHVHAEFRAMALAEVPGATVVAIADADRERGEAAAARFGVDRYTDSWEEIVSMDDVDVVMVHSENSLHADQVVASANAGKHVFCEKPVATTAKDAQRMVEAIEVAGVDGTAAFVSRFSKEASKTKQLVESGVLGDIVHARALIGLAGISEIGCPPDMTAWMEDRELGGGGAWIDEGSHAIDLLRWLVGDISSVALRTANRAKPRFDVEDIGIATVEFVDGAVGTVETSWSLALDIGMRNHVELYGSKGTLLMRATDPNSRVEVFDGDVAADRAGWLTPHIVVDDAEPHDYSSWPPHTHHYKREVASYVSRYLSDSRPYGPTFRDGLACASIIEAGYQSARSDGAPRRVGTDPGG